MEDPGNRRLILARLRGLLEPGYEYGTVSFLAERLILASISLKEEAEAVRALAEVQASTIQLLDRNSRSTVFEKMKKNINNSVNMAMLIPAKKEDQEIDYDAFDSMVKTYNAIIASIENLS